MLTPKERTFLTSLRDGYASQAGWATCKSNPPSAKLQSLVDRGYCRLAPARAGPLCAATGEVMIGLTEAAKVALRDIEQLTVAAA